MFASVRAALTPLARGAAPAVALTMATVGMLVAAPEARGAGARPNFLFLVVDTLRADALGTYGQPKPTSPNIDALARRGVVFEHAWTQYTWTLPSFVSYMSSRHARTHGWDYPMGKLDKYAVLDTQAPLLAEVLRGGGYATAGHYSNAHIKPELGLARGFSTWTKGADVGVTRGAVADISKWSGDAKPNFLYVHWMAPHEPVVPSAESLAAVGATMSVDPKVGVSWKRWHDAAAADKDAVRDQLRLAYLAAVRDADANVGKVLDALKASGEADNTVIVLFSDHGELLGEHDTWGHTSWVWEELNRVPLIVSAPGVPPKRVTDRVGRLVDIAPMVVRMAGITKPAQWQGTDLLNGPAPTYAAVERDGWSAFTDGRAKTIEDRASGKLKAAYDLVADKGERTPITAAPAGAWAGLIQSAAAWRTATPSLDNTGPILQLDEANRAATEEQLRQLGYMD
jgi:arylsulfatase A-like enzyme